MPQGLFPPEFWHSEGHGHTAAVSWPSCLVVVSREPQTKAGVGPNVSMLEVWPVLCLGKKLNAEGSALRAVSRCLLGQT